MKKPRIIRRKKALKAHPQDTVNRIGKRGDVFVGGRRVPPKIPAPQP